eukprot:150508_1
MDRHGTSSKHLSACCFKTNFKYVISTIITMQILFLFAWYSSNYPYVIETRVVVSISATPNEIQTNINSTINWILGADQTYKIDAFYLQIPYMQIRNNNKLYPTTSKLKTLFPQEKIIINRLFVDYGPMSRYIGIMDLETDPETIIISFDIDITRKQKVNNFISKFVKHMKYDPNSWWTMHGESVVFNVSKQEIIGRKWQTSPIEYDDENEIAWDIRTIFRATGGIAYKRKFLDNLWYNATEYYIGCFWDDDHWMSFNLNRKGIMIKIIQKYVRDHQSQRRRRLGSLTKINSKLNSPKLCPENIMKVHPNIWTEMRVV